MRNPAIIYLVTRVHGLRTHLITREMFLSMVKAKGLPSIVEILLRTDYEGEVSKLSREMISAAELSGIFESMLAQRYYYLIKISPRSVRRFMEIYARRFEIENVKRVLRYLAGAAERYTLIPIPREYSYVNYKAMAESRSIEDALEFLRETPYSGALEKLPAYKKYGSLMIIEGALDSIYYSEVWKAANTVPSKNAVKRVVGYEMDLKNIFNIVGLKIQMVPSDAVREVALKTGYRLKADTISSLVSTKVEGLPELLSPTPYSNLIPDLRRAIELNDVHLLRKTIFQHIYSEARRAASQYATNLGFVVAYLLLCEAEYRNLIAITTGKELELAEEELSQLIM